MPRRHRRRPGFTRWQEPVAAGEGKGRRRGGDGGVRYRPPLAGAGRASYRAVVLLGLGKFGGLDHSGRRVLFYH